MTADDIRLPPLPSLQVPRIDADVSLTDIKVLVRWCERVAIDYARAAIMADRASREPSPQGDAELLKHPAITHCEWCGCDWLDNGLNPIGCPYCKLRQDSRRGMCALER